MAEVVSEAAIENHTVGIFRCLSSGNRTRDDSQLGVHLYSSWARHETIELILILNNFIAL